MKKKTSFLLVVIILAIVGLGIYKAEPGDMLYALKSWTAPVEYVANIDNEIDALEVELADLEAKIESGELTETEATLVRERITSRMINISSAATDAEGTALSPEARARINDSLTRLSNALVTYRDSLIIVDAVADGEVLGVVKQTLNVRPHTKSSRLLTIVTNTVETLEDHVEEVLGDEYEGDQSDIIDSEGLVDENGDPITEDDTSTTTDMGDGGAVDADVSDMIVLNAPQSGEAITSPLTMTGEARGGWYFEATFPVVLTNWDGLIIAEGYAEAEGDWMTEEFVPFSATLTFEKPEYGDNGFLILQKANASGLPEHDAALEIEIMFE